jgi:hypothetical protein
MNLSKTKIVLFLLSAILISTLSISANEKSEYEYKIGERLASSFSENCSLLIGRIQSLQEQKAILIIQERLSGNKTDESTLELNNIVSPKYPRFSYSPWNYVEIRQGYNLFVSDCGNGISQNYGVIVSNEDLFLQIREVISYQKRFKENQSILLEVPQLLTQNDNIIFIGYITSLLRSGVPENKNDLATVLSQLIGNNNLPTISLVYGRISLRQILVKENENALLPETRNSVIGRVVNIAGSAGNPAEQSVTLLLELADKGKLNIKPFLNKKNKQNILKNYRNIASNVGTTQGRKEFEKQLANL